MCWDAVLSGFFGLPKGYATDECPGDKVNATKLRSRLLPSVPKVDLAPILWPRRGCLCRNNASEVSSCLHSCGRIKQTAATKCRANHAYASSLFSAVAFRAICQQGLYGHHWYQHHLLIDTCTCPVSSNLMRQMHSSHTRPCTTSCLRGYGHL